MVETQIDIDLILAVGVFHASVLFWAYRLAQKAQGMSKLLWQCFAAAWLPQLVIRMTDMSIVGSLLGSLVLFLVYLLTIGFYLALLLGIAAVKERTGRQ